LTFLDRTCGVADDDDDVAEVDGGEVAQRDVEDGGLPVDRDQGLRERVGVWAKPSPCTGGQHHADHRSPLVGESAASPTRSLTLPVAGRGSPVPAIGATPIGCV